MRVRFLLVTLAILLVGLILPGLNETNIVDLSPEIKQLRDRYPNIKKGVCPLGRVVE